MEHPKRTSAIALAAAASLLAACGSDLGPRQLPREDSVAEQSTPLGGEALAQRSREMRRAQRDMAHFHRTLESLAHRRDRSGSLLFAGFLDAYMGLYLDPLLESEWQSRHPELMAVDATLRLLKADLLIRLREPGRAQDVIDELRARFQGRESMLVEYPVGAQGTLLEGIERLAERKWWRG